MHGDFSRNTHRPRKQFNRALQQQGRVQLDADANEQAEIQHHLARVTRRDVIGYAGYPVKDGAFKLTPTPDGDDLFISLGRFYVDGLVVEVDPTPLPATLPADDATAVEVPVWDPDDQPFAKDQWVELQGRGVPPLRRRVTHVSPGTRRLKLGAAIPAAYRADGVEPTLRRLPTLLTRPHAPDALSGLLAAGSAAIYLEVFERHVSEVEDPDLKEKALGGPDTTTRVQTAWRLVAKGAKADATCSDEALDWPPEESEARLSTSVSPDAETDDPCVLPALGGYRGVENRLYRVEIHDPGDVGAATFKWSRDNGSVTYAIADYDETDAKKVTLRRLGRDRTVALRRDDWVEVLDDRDEMEGKPGKMVRVSDVDPATSVVTLAQALTPAAPHLRPKLRRWDMGAAPAKVGKDVVELESGVRVRFSGRGFATGDAWSFAARAPDRSVETLHAVPPMNAGRRRARLAIVAKKGSDWRVQDCRRPFRPLVDGRGGCCVTVGDGVRSHGDFTSIQHAVDFVGGLGRVCVLAGEHRLDEPVVIRGARHLVLEGCGRPARILAPKEKPAFVAERCDGLGFEGLRVEARAPEGAVVLRHSRRVRVERCELINTDPTSPRRDPLNPRRPWSGDEEREGAGAGGSADAASFPDVEECEPYGPALAGARTRRLVVRGSLLVGKPALHVQATGLLVEDNDVRGGGIHLRDGTGSARVLRNHVMGGWGAGVQLGEDPPDPKRTRGVHQVEVRGNRIHRMGGCGISSRLPEFDEDGQPRTEDPRKLVPPLVDLAIEGNDVRGCGWEEPRVIAGISLAAGIRLVGATGARIHGNRVVETGRAALHRASGIMVFGWRGVEICGNTVRDNGTLPPPALLREVDFSLRPTGTQRGPSRVENGVTFTVHAGTRDANGDGYSDEFQPASETRVVEQDGHRGLLCRQKTEIVFPELARRVELRLFARSPGRVVVRTRSGSDVTRTFSSAQASQDVVVARDDIERVVVESTKGDALLERFAAVEHVEAPRQAGVLVELADAPLPVRAPRIRRTAPPGGAREVGFRRPISREEAGSRYRRMPPEAFALAQPPPSWGPLAVKAHDNVVAAPSGRALFIEGAGLLSVVGNVLSTEGVEDPRLEVGGHCVEVREVTRLPDPKMVVMMAMVHDAHPAGTAPPPDNTTGTSQPTADRASQPSTTSPARAEAEEQEHPEPGLRFAGNQVSLRAALQEEDALRSAVLLRSAHDLSMQDNLVSSWVGEGKLQRHVDVEGSSVRVQGNRIREQGDADWSLRVRAARAGLVLGNQTDRCILTAGTVTEGFNQLLETSESACRERRQAEGEE